MEKILPEYYKHLKKYPRSLLGRVYGIYKIEMEGYKTVRMILMGNTLRFQNKSDVVKVYDIKGSLFNRFVKITSSVKATTTLKDSNFMKDKRELQQINLSPKQVRILN